ncbi:MAG: DUF4376 domain-containing protein [Rhodoferax sp.]|nr:DUF4376 domain-containing protein [Rhodoferax sp.]
MTNPIEQVIVFEKATGRVVSSGTTQLPQSLVSDTLDVLVGAEGRPGASYVEAASVVEIPVKPSVHHVFDWAAKTWVDPRSLQDLKDARWAEVRRERDSAEFGGFNWDGSRFDSDALSQQRITGAVTLAMMNSAFSIGWTLADNTVRTLNAADMIAVGVALGQHVNACHERARVLRGEIGGAEMAEMVT